MSIIYGALERLETDSPPLAHIREQSSSTGQVVEPRGLPIKTLVTALLLAMTGANLLLWYWSNEAQAPQYATPAVFSNQMEVPGVSGQESASATITEAPAKPLERIESNSGTATDREAAPRNTLPTVEVVKANAQRVAEAPLVSSPGSIEKSATLAEDSVDPPGPPALRSEAISAEPADRIPVPSGDEAYKARVEKVIEGARRALTRGQYQQALLSLELLQPVPGHLINFLLQAIDFFL